MKRVLPKYPVYVPSKGRVDRCLTAKFLHRDRVPFRLVVEPQEAEAYRLLFEDELCEVLVLPFRNRGSVIPTRNWIKEHATAEGADRHWQLDDNIESLWRLNRGVRLRCRAGVALRATEDFVDRYENVAVAGLNYVMFAVAPRMPPFYLNVHVYSCSLILNSLPYEWRGRYNEDTDFCLQALAGGWCTVLMNAFLAQKIRTMVIGGGNTKELYGGDGRLRMARSLERAWPGVVETRRRFGRPQHVVKNQWRRFDTPLRKRSDVEIPDESPYDIRLTQAKGEVRSPFLRRLLEEQDR